MFQLNLALGLWPETTKVSFSRSNQTVNKCGRQNKPAKTFLNFTYLHKRRTKNSQDKKLLEISRSSLNESAHHTFGYTRFDTGQNIYRFQRVMTPQTHDLFRFQRFWASSILSTLFIPKKASKRHLKQHLFS